jgi:hypothetical protein
MMPVRRAPLLLFLVLLAGTTRGRSDAVPAPPTVCDLKQMTPDELEQLFVHGQVGACPVGLGRGTTLLRTEGKLPRLRSRLSGSVWKGKFFYSDGGMTNQWVGFRAVEGNVAAGPSWLDGRPCLTIEYPPGTIIFGNTRDELREIAPGMYLGRFYERCPCQKLQGYFVLEMECCKK